ncbi:SalB [Treponema primitia ZAS-2]|uniref:SalB n=1 Tax=Treponema primitia (strain ATCC BAA-887 / DSM 12427 / ZAS-2) TaxID=545694 RepID=F5YQW1_TREPZ|nr:2Fe-2S iron-sulfur cluster-binding protein [Treponema primitia]AEF84084.1 SalB [Treponema primitia ZAS-2]
MGQIWQVRVPELGKDFPCKEDESVFAAMIRARTGPVTYGCAGGGCGACRMRISSGEWEAFKNMSVAHVTEDDRKEGIVLLCCVQPRSDLTIARV